MADDDEEEETGDFSFDIHVVYEDGSPASGTKVYVNFGLWYGHESEYTDDDGHARFCIPDCPFTGRATTVKVYVGDKEGEDYEIEDGDGFTIEI